jgi:hypothetical protein
VKARKKGWSESWEESVELKLGRRDIKKPGKRYKIKTGKKGRHKSWEAGM